MTKMIDYPAVAHACDLVNGRCSLIEGTRHGSAWLYDQVMRAFQHPACVSVTFVVFITAINGLGEATIDRDGNLTMRRHIGSI